MEYKFKKEEYWIEGKNGKIYGQLYIPDREGKLPFIIISHGFNGSYIDNLTYADHFAKKGFIVYIYDFNGGSITSQSEGNMLNMSVMTEVQDLEDIINHFKEFTRIDLNKIVLIGKSQGGVVSAIVAARHPYVINRLVLIYPAFVIHDDARKELAGYTKETLPEIYKVFGEIEVGRIYAEDIWDYDVYSEIRNFKGPVLIIHGSLDTLVPYSYSEEACDVYDNAELYILDGAGHGFRQIYTEVTFDLIDNFVRTLIRRSRR